MRRHCAFVGLILAFTFLAGCGGGGSSSSGGGSADFSVHGYWRGTARFYDTTGNLLESKEKIAMDFTQTDDLFSGFFKQLTKPVGTNYCFPSGFSITGSASNGQVFIHSRVGVSGRLDGSEKKLTGGLGGTLKGPGCFGSFKAEISIKKQ